MKKRLIKIIIWLVIFLGILGFEAYNNNTKKEVLISVVQLKRTLEKGSSIRREDVIFHEIPEAYYQDNMVISDDYTQPLYLNTKAFEGGYLLYDQINKESIFQLDEDQRLITVKCSIVGSNAWQSDLFDRVDILMVENELTHIIEDALVYKRYNQQLEEAGLPEYYVFIVNSQDALFYYEHLKASDVYIVIK